MAEPLFDQRSKGNVRAQLGVDDPTSPANAMVNIGQVLGGAAKDTAMAPLPRVVTDEGGTAHLVHTDPRTGEQTITSSVSPQGRSMGWDEWLRGLGDWASLAIGGRGGFGPYKVGGREALRSSQQALREAQG